jgi:hypothetical protein
MSKIVKAKLVEGRPISLDFEVSGEWIGYEVVCPKCGIRVFVISEDKSKIACATIDCFTIIFLRFKETISDMSEVTWKIN